MVKVYDQYQKNNQNCLGNIIVRDSVMSELLTVTEELFSVLGKPGEIVVNTAKINSKSFDVQTFDYELYHEYFHTLEPKIATAVQKFPWTRYSTYITDYNGLSLVLQKNDSAKKSLSTIMTEAGADAVATPYYPKGYFEKYSGYNRLSVFMNQMITDGSIKRKDIIRAEKTSDVRLFVAKVLHTKKQKVTGEKILFVTDLLFSLVNEKENEIKEATLKLKEMQGK